MGNICVSREDDLAESRRQYDNYVFLWHEVISKLSDHATLTSESAQLYQEECAQRNTRYLAKQNWEEACAPFLQRLCCGDVSTKQRIFAALEELYPGPAERIITEAMFAEFNRLALQLAERDLRWRIAKLKEKYGGIPPAPPTNGNRDSPDFWSGLLGPDRVELNTEPLSLVPKSKQSASQPPSFHSPAQSRDQFRGDEMQAPPPVSFGDASINADPALGQWEQSPDPTARIPRNPQSLGESELRQKLHLPLSAQHLQEQQRQEAEQPSLASPRGQNFNHNWQWQEPVKPGQSQKDMQRDASLKQNVHVPLSAQRLQELQRKQAEEAQKMKYEAARADTARADAARPQPARVESFRQQEESMGKMSPRSLAEPSPVGTTADSGILNSKLSIDQVSCVLADVSGLERSQSSSAMEPFHSRQSLNSKAELSKSNVSPPRRMMSGSLAASDVASNIGSERSMRQFQGRAKVQHMRKLILDGQLEVSVFNKHLVPEKKRFGLDPTSRQVSILRSDGLCEDSWGIDNLRCISFGIATNILPNPPPADKTLTFRFAFQGNEDRFLCAIFENGEVCRLAAAAFSQLCSVPVVGSGE